MKRKLKTIAALFIIPLIVPACTSLAINNDGSGKYRNGLFQKQFSEMSYSKAGSNSITLTVKGYKSDAAQFVQALEIVKQAYSGK